MNRIKYYISYHYQYNTTEIINNRVHKTIKVDRGYFNTFGLLEPYGSNNNRDNALLLNSYNEAVEWLIEHQERGYFYRIIPATEEAEADMYIQPQKGLYKQAKENRQEIYDYWDLSKMKEGAKEIDL